MYFLAVLNIYFGLINLTHAQAMVEDMKNWNQYLKIGLNELKNFQLGRSELFTISNYK